MRHFKIKSCTAFRWAFYIPWLKTLAHHYHQNCNPIKANRSICSRIRMKIQILNLPKCRITQLTLKANPLIPQPWAYAAKASSLEFVSITSGKQENQFSFLRSKKLHSSLQSTWCLWGLYLALKSSSSFLGNESLVLACWAWSSSLNIGAWCHLRCCTVAASSSFSLPYLTAPGDIRDLQSGFRWCWTPLLKQRKQVPCISICYGKMCFPRKKQNKICLVLSASPSIPAGVFTLI